MKMKLLGLLLFSLCVFFACQKRADQILTPKEKYQKEFADWLHSQKNSFSDEQLLVEKDKIARLNWGAANYFETEKTSFLEVPYAFQAAQNSQSTGLVTNNNQNSSTLFSLVFAKSKQNGTVEARVLLKDKFDKLINGVSVKEVYLFDDLAGKRRRSYFRAAGNTRLTRMYRDDNQANTQVQQIGSTGTVTNFCISIQIPVYDLKCDNVNNADPGSSFGYPTTCTYTLVGWANFNSGCAAWQTQSLEPPDTFDYDGFGIGGSGGDNTSKDTTKPKTPCPTSTESLKAAFPSANDEALDSLTALVNEYGGVFGIDNSIKLQHFISQAAHETGRFLKLTQTESLYYTSTSRLIEVFPKKFSYTDPSMRNPDAYLRKEKETANYVYAGLNQNGNEASGDGFRYRGRGIFQLTAKANYQMFQDFYNKNFNDKIDLVNNPDLLVSNNRLSALSAMWFFKHNVLRKIQITENTTVKEITKRINGGKNGLRDRTNLLNITKQYIFCL